MWRKIPDWLFYLIIVILIYANSNRASEKIPPPSQPPELGPLLPSETPSDERIIVNIDKPKSGIGTAFAIDGKGYWITARHVEDCGCGDFIVHNPLGHTFKNCVS